MDNSLRSSAITSSRSNPSDTPLATTRRYTHPFIVPPSTNHAYSFILLHGRGSNGLKFGAEFIASISSSGETLAEIFPSAKWIFPTAKKRRAALFKRLPIHQWFDIYDINQQSYREHLQVDGLQETTELVHDFIEQEISNGIPVENIVLGGLSQGCASSLYATLCYYQRLGGYVGMCGWLPFARDVQTILGISPNDDNLDGVDIFGTSDDDDEHSTTFEDEKEATETQDKAAKTPVSEAIKFLKENISFSGLHNDNLAVSKTPIFLGHGVLDEKVQFRLGEQARDVLNGLGFEVSWKSYDDLGHWYQIPDEIDDIARFLKTTLKLESTLDNVC